MAEQPPQASGAQAVPPAPVPSAKSEEKAGEDSKVGQLKVIGGLIALGLGLFTLLVVLGLSLISNVSSRSWARP